MIKKIAFVLFLVFVFSLITIEVSGTSSFYASYMYGCFIAWLIVSSIFGWIAQYISDSKGYDTGFAWGFWFGFIGLLVVGFRPNLKNKPVQTQVVIKDSNSFDSLERLAILHKQGILTDEEFQRKKDMILFKD